MRVAIISDIHGNLTALQAVLPELKKEADRVVCLGDVAATGPQPHETIALLMRLKIPCVMGNADESIWKGSREGNSRTGMPEEDVRRLEALDAWTDSRVTESDKKYLATFQPTIRIRAANQSLLCYHGSPSSNTRGILAISSDDEVSSMLSGHDATVFAGGHTHSQMARPWKSSVVINPGSVGLPFVKGPNGKIRNPTWAEYAIVSLGAKGLKVELRRTSYNLPKLAGDVRKSGMPNPEWWLADWI